MVIDPRCFRAYFQDLRDIGDRATLIAIGADCGLDPGFLELQPGERRGGRDRAAAPMPSPAGSASRGVPCFVFDGRYALAGAQDRRAFLPLFDMAAGTCLSRRPGTGVAERPRAVVPAQVGEGRRQGRGIGSTRQFLKKITGRPPRPRRPFQNSRGLSHLARRRPRWRTGRRVSGRGRCAGRPETTFPPQDGCRPDRRTGHSAVWRAAVERQVDMESGRPRRPGAVGGGDGDRIGGPRPGRRDRGSRRPWSVAPSQVRSTASLSAPPSRPRTSGP